MIRYRAHGATNPGRVRERNEDAMALALVPGSTSAIAVVADGVGGEPGGDVASRFVVRTVRDHLLDAGGLPGAGADLAPRLAAAVEQAHGVLRDAQASTPALARMASTAVAILAAPDRVAIAHVGDSRCYRWRTGTLELLTHDHTVAQQMVDDGTLPQEQATRVPYGNVLTRALGSGERLDVVCKEVPVAPGDRFLLCSDGLTRVMATDELAAVLARDSGPSGMVSALIATAYAAGAPDNMTAIVLEAMED